MCAFFGFEEHEYSAGDANKARDYRDPEKSLESSIEQKRETKDRNPYSSNSSDFVKNWTVDHDASSPVIGGTDLDA